MRETKSTFSVGISVAPALRTTTVTGTGIDLANVFGNAIVIVCGALTDGVHTPTIEESDTLGSGYTAVAAADTVGTLAALTANSSQKVSYTGMKRYVRVVITTTGSPATGAAASALVLQDAPRSQPTA